MNELFIAFAGAVVGFAAGFVTCALFGRLDSDKGHNYGEPDEHAGLIGYGTSINDAMKSQENASKVYWTLEPHKIPKHWE